MSLKVSKQSVWSSHFVPCHPPLSIDLSSYQWTCQADWFSECNTCSYRTKCQRDGKTAPSTVKNINFLLQRHHSFICLTSPRHRQPSRDSSQCWGSESLFYMCPWKLQSPSKCFCLHLGIKAWDLSSGSGWPEETTHHRPQVWGWQICQTFRSTAAKHEAKLVW